MCKNFNVKIINYVSDNNNNKHRVSFQLHVILENKTVLLFCSIKSVGNGIFLNLLLCLVCMCV